MAITRKILFNTLAGGVSRIISLAISFITTPVMILTLGDHGFGLFTLVAALTAYAGLLDFGIGPGLTRHYAEFSEKGDLPAVRQVTTFAVGFYAVLSVLIGVPLYLAAPTLADWLTADPAMRDLAVTNIILMFGWFILSCVTGVFGSRLTALGRMDMVSLIQLVAQVLYAVLVFAALPYFPTVTAAVVFTILQMGLALVAMAALVVRHDGNPFANPFTIPRDLVRKLVAFGGWMQILNLAGIIQLEFDKLVVSHFLGVRALTPYQIGNRLATLNRIIPHQFLQAVLPAATSVSVRTRGPDLEAFFVRTNRYLMVMTLFITGYVVAESDRLVLAWIGRPYPEAVLVVIGLSVAFAVNNVTGGSSTIVRAAGVPRYEAYAAMVGVPLNIVLTVAAAPVYGLPGILAATVVANIIGSVFFLVLFSRTFGFPIGRTILVWLGPLLGVTLAAGAGVEAIHALFPPSADDGRLVQLALLVAEGLVYAGIFVGGLTLARFATADERLVVRGVLTRLPLVRRVAA